MMKYVLLVALVGVALAMPQSDITIVRSDIENPGTGEYQWGYETSDGSKADATGALRDGVLEDGTNGQFQTVQGSYSYTAPDGRLITVTYTSDDKGYRAKTTYA
ncbi:Larval cuticle protein 16/17 [Orchesella cincta]|uniref:Larval cuticle protein 16/17 n=1 Tax=Orchesella cincta TaxID=48709 RepID=A0A1D2MQK7_ORCCI|nr:Larval cuticle protein 16/17 [Orchesella cincta]